MDYCWLPFSKVALRGGGYPKLCVLASRYPLPLREKPALDLSSN